MNSLCRAILKFSLCHSTAFFVGAAFMMPQGTQFMKVVHLSKPLIITAHRADPPGLLFEIFEEKILNSAEDQSLSINLNEVLKDPNFESQKEPGYLAAIKLEPLVFSKEDIANPINSDEWRNALSESQKTRLRLSKVTTNDISNLVEAIDIDEPAGSQTINKNLKFNVARGEVRLVDGAILGTRDLRLRWYRNGKIEIDRGLNPIHPQFEVRLPTLEGILTAEIIDADRSVVASGEVALDSVAGSMQEKLVISVRPVNQISSRVHNFNYVTDRLFPPTSRVATNRKAIADDSVVRNLSINVEEASQAGAFRFDKIAKNSWSILEVTGKNKYPGIFLVNEGETLDLPVFTNSLVSAILSIQRSYREETYFQQNDSLVYGQVLLNDQPVSGVNVSIENADSQKVLYYTNANEMLLPDSRAQATLASGYFSFADLPDGVYSVIAKKDQKLFGHANVIVRAGHISPIKIDNTIEQTKLSIKAFDAFLGTPQGVRVTLQSLQEPIESGGSEEAFVSRSKKLSIAEIEPASSRYLNSRVIYSEDQGQIEIPLIHSEWFDSIRRMKQISDSAQGASAIGFVPERDFEVFLGESDLQKDQVVYFDSKGNLTEKGEKGGGFILFGLTDNYNSIVVLADKSELVSTRVNINDPATTTVFQFDF